MLDQAEVVAGRVVNAVLGHLGGLPARWCGRPKQRTPKSKGRPSCGPSGKGGDLTASRKRTTGVEPATYGLGSRRSTN
jgi:hypothetical protein